MKISPVPLFVAGGILLAVTINLNTEYKKEKEDLINQVKNLREANNQFKEDINQFKEDINLIKKSLKRKEDLIREKEEKIKEIEKNIGHTKATRGTTNKSKLLGTFEATAYTDDVQSQGKWVGQTATGMKPRVGVIAVDPKVIPLGTKLYVEGYGNCIAGDTGGAIKGNRIDIFKNTSKDCREWGRRKVKVYRRD